MGMAASQARWISLAARKTNVEYEGQQINQARTALANQSAELWNKLYKMDVPTAPSTTDYTKTTYTFQIGDSAKTIENIQEADKTIDGITYNAYVTYSSDVTEYKGIRVTNSNPQVQKVTPTGEPAYYMIGTKKLKNLADCRSSEEYPTYVEALNQLKKDWPDSPVAKAWNPETETITGNIWLWEDSANETNFVIQGDNSTPDTLEYCMANPSELLHSYYSDYQTTTKDLSKYALIDYDSSGRAKSIQLQDSTVV